MRNVQAFINSTLVICSPCEILTHTHEVVCIIYFSLGYLDLPYYNKLAAYDLYAPNFGNDKTVIIAFETIGIYEELGTLGS